MSRRHHSQNPTPPLSPKKKEAQPGFFKRFYRQHPTLTKALTITAPVIAIGGWLITNACTPAENSEMNLIESTESGKVAVTSIAQQAGDLMVSACTLLQGIGIVGAALRPTKNLPQRSGERNIQDIPADLSKIQSKQTTTLHRAQLDKIGEFLEGKIVASTDAEKLYNTTTKFKFLKDKKYLKYQLLKEAKVNRAFRCKLWKMIETKKLFKIEICLPHEPTLLTEKIMARYDSKRAAIVMPIDRIKSPDDISSLVHEVHHVDTEDANDKRGQRIWQTGSSSPVVTAHPCNSNQNNYIDCTEIKTIIENGKANAQRLLSLLDKDSRTLTNKEKRELETYHKLRANYEPLTLELPQTAQDIIALKQQGIINDNLSIKQNIIDRSAGFEATLGPFVKRRGRVFMQIHSCYKSSNAKVCDNPNTPQRPLHDFLLLLKNVEKIQSDPYVSIEEQDAAANQALERYPELFDLIVPGLRTYHEERNTDLYRQCLSS